MSSDHAGPAAKPSICVYCGAKTGADPKYAQAARDVGRGLAEGGFRLIYGAGDLGLMGETARACQAAGGEAMGFIPRGLWEREIARRELPHIVITENLHQRKSLMLQNADGAIVLPGGVGTLDELVEALTWRQIGLHDKPLILLDLDGFWRPLNALFEHMAREGFLHGDLAAHYALAATPAEAVAALRAGLD